jgi:X-Pro dipeptidyl-peptidase
MRAGARRLAAAAAAFAALSVGGTAQAQSPTIVVENGKTAPAFGYADAVRERVFIPLPGVDQDSDGQPDRTAIELMRPKATNEGLKAPAIIDPSPYYTTLGRGNEGQLIADIDGDGLNDRWPLFYDNYFVPRGYAFIHAEMNGTGNSTGCPMHGGPGDIESMKAVIDWLNGRRPGFDKDGNPVTAPWHNGKAAMIGKSYDGTLANGVAATGVEGLSTIVPISAISQWYEYSRTGGIRHNTNYPGNSLQPQITNPDRRALCAASRTQMNNEDGDEHGDVNQFWLDRDHLKDVDKVRASVFITHGTQDDNVRFNQATVWWDALKARGVPRKMWITRTGHEDPFDFRRAHWVDTLHRWFDHELQGLANGILDEPKVDVELAKDVFETAADWPVPGSALTDVFLQGIAPGSAGAFGLASGGATDTLSWTDANFQNEGAIINTPLGQQASRRVFLSPRLKTDLRISGTPVIDIEASVNGTQTNLGAALVEYGPTTQVSRSGDGIQNVTPEERDCWGESSANTNDACYLKVFKPESTQNVWRVTKGILDTSNRDSLLATAATPITVDQKYRFRWPIFPHDYVFKAGNQIGLVLIADYTQFSSVAGTGQGATVTLDTKSSRMQLPIVGGATAAAASGAFVADTEAPSFGDIADVEAGTTSLDGRTVDYTLPVATDTQDPSPTVTCAPPSGSMFAIGTTVVTCTATDANGNTSTGTFDVVVSFIDEDDGDVDGEVPATLNLAVGNAAPFSAFTPGLGRAYLTSMSATVTSTAADALLTVSDPSATATGHLVNGAFALPQALQANASSAGGVGGDYTAIGGSAAPTHLLAYAGPVSNDSVTIGLKQSIGANDALRTGTYAKTLTFTLSTTSP